MDVDLLITNIKKYCSAAGVGVTNACAESGAGKSLVSELIRGHRPAIDRLQSLANYLGVTTSELLGEKIGPVSDSDTSLDDALSSYSPKTRAIVMKILGLPPQLQSNALDYIDYLVSKQ